MVWFDPDDVERALENFGREVSFRRRKQPASTVPDLRGLAYHEAQDKCLEVHLMLRHAADPTAAEGEGVVVGQEPLPGTVVAPKSTVLVTLEFPETGGGS